MMRLWAVPVLLIVSAGAAVGASVHAGSMVVPDFDEVIKFHFPPPMTEFFDPYAKDGVNRVVPQLFPRAEDGHDFHKSGNALGGGAPGVLGNLGGLAKLATNSISEILGSREKGKQPASADKEPSTSAWAQEQAKIMMLHAGTWLVEAPEEIPNLELPSMNYRGKWIGEEKMGGGWSSVTNPLTDEWRGAPMSERMQKLQMQNPGKTMEEIMVEDGELQKFVDEDGQEHLVPKKSAAPVDEGTPMLRRSNPALI